MEFNATFIVAFISFVIFVVIMNLILYKPIENIVLERQKFIDDNYDVAQKNSDQSKILQNEKDEKISNAKQSAKEELAKKIDEAKEKRENVLKETKTIIQNELIQKQQEMLEAKNSASVELKNDVVNLAQQISDKFFAQKEEIDNNLIEEMIKG